MGPRSGSQDVGSKKCVKEKEFVCVCLSSDDYQKNIKLMSYSEEHLNLFWGKDTNSASVLSHGNTHLSQQGLPTESYCHDNNEVVVMKKVWFY